MILPRSFLIYGALAALLSGCVAPESTWTTRSEIFIERDETAFVPGALDGAIEALGGSSGGGSLLSQDTSDPDEDDGEDLVYTVPRSAMLGARIHAERAMSKRATWTVSATGALGKSTYFLPDGAEIPINPEVPTKFEEPITVKFQTASIDLAAGAKRRVYDGQKFDVDLTGTAGILFTLTKTDVASPIFILDDWETQELPYVSLAVKLTANRKGKATGKARSQPFLTLGARAYPGVGARFVTQLGMQF
ncbi:hypothetical protein NBRC116590_06140 [Pelagimonas sp. KU-00592-HH]|uniref:hypothetical protein n=1 Tax=Pelagimonas sp. KU-00592-HH TaxID=3127651 RepID=UPI00310ACA31